MSDETNAHDESNDSGAGDGIASLRKQYEQTQKELKALREENLAFKAKERTSSVASILKSKGLSEKAAALYSGDDTSEDAVNKWIEDFSDVFGVKSASATDQNSNDAQRVTDFASGGGNEPGSALTPDGKVLGNPAEMEQLMRTLPVEKLVEMGWLGKDALRSI